MAKKVKVKNLFDNIASDYDRLNHLLSLNIDTMWRRRAPTIGGWVSGNRGACRYLPASVLHFPAPDRFVAMMREAGFGDVRHRAFTFGICRMYIGSKVTVE